MRYVFVIIACLLAIGAVYLTFLQGYSGGAGFEGRDAPAIVPVILTGLVMAFGIFFGSMFRRMGSVDRQVDILAEMRDVLRSSRFIATLCVCPFVFLGAYALVRDTPGDPASYLLAFQNGFFCEAIFRRMFRDDGTPTGPLPKAP